MPDSTRVNLLLDRAIDTPAIAGRTVDLAWPKTAGSGRPVVLFVHGGGWDSGDTRAHYFDMLRLANAGYVSASLGYRLAPTNRFPSQLADVRCAIGVVRSWVTLLGGDSSRVVVVGVSAGAHLASLVATTADQNTADAGYDASCRVGTTPAPLPTVRGVASVSGPQDLRATNEFSSTGRALIAGFLGTTPAANPTLAAAASPVVRLHGATPPFLFVHGTADSDVTVAQPTRMRDALKARGTNAMLVTIAGGGHELPLFVEVAPLKPVACALLSFFAETVGTP